MQVIKALDGELGTNHSLVGSMVSGNLSTSAMSYERIEKLGTNGIPDIILISAGCNDWGFCALPEEFEEAYRTMLHRIKEQYPHADIYCATLPEGKQPQGETFFNIDSTISKRVYSDIIRENALSEGEYPSKKVIIRVTGEGFLHNMVRIISGTLIKVGLGVYPPEHVKQILEACDRSQAGETVPAKGLFLKKIEYL